MLVPLEVWSFSLYLYDSTEILHTFTAVFYSVRHPGVKHARYEPATCDLQPIILTTTPRGTSLIINRLVYVRTIFSC